MVQNAGVASSALRDWTGAALPSACPGSSIACGLPAGQPTIPALTPEQIEGAWRQAKVDRRFILFGQLAVDKSRVCAVSLNGEQSEGNIGFELSANHGVNLVLPAELVAPILGSVPEPKAGGN